MGAADSPSVDCPGPAARGSRRRTRRRARARPSSPTGSASRSPRRRCSSRRRARPRKPVRRAPRRSRGRRPAPLPGVVDEQLLTGAVLLAHHQVELRGPGLVLVAEPAVLQPLRVQPLYSATATPALRPCVAAPGAIIDAGNEQESLVEAAEFLVDHAIGVPRNDRHFAAAARALATHASDYEDWHARVGRARYGARDGRKAVARSVLRGNGVRRRQPRGACDGALLLGGRSDAGSKRPHAVVRGPCCSPSARPGGGDWAEYRCGGRAVRRSESENSRRRRWLLGRSRRPRPI